MFNLSASAIIEAPESPILLAVKYYVSIDNLHERLRFVSDVCNLSASAIIETPDDPILLTVKYDVSKYNTYL